MVDAITSIRNAGKNLEAFFSKTGSFEAGKLLLAAADRVNLQKVEQTRDASLFDNLSVLLAAYLDNSEKVLTYVDSESANFVTRRIPQVSRLVIGQPHINARLYSLLVNSSRDEGYARLGDYMKEAIEDLKIALSQAKSEEVALAGSRVIYDHLIKKMGA